MSESAPTGRDLLRKARKEAESMTPEELKELLDSGKEVVILDIRDDDEWTEGHLPEAVHVPRSYLELQIDDAAPDRAKTMVVYCAGGNRSALAWMTLKELGYTDVINLSGGFTRWKDAGLPVVQPKKWTPEQRDRYSRHFILPEVGEEGQRKIAEAKILVVGAGGLGSPAIYYLAAAGVGTLGIVDFDNVEANNLQRQIIHSTARVGTNKAVSAASTVEELNPDVEVKTWTDRLSPDNVDELVSQFDVVVDTTDNFSTRYMLNQAAVDHAKPYIYGSIFRFEGFASVFWPAQNGPCYRCLYEEAPPDELAPT